jgi:hypothetical protein
MDYDYVNPRLQVKELLEEEDLDAKFSPEEVFKEIVQPVILKESQRHSR